MLVQWYIMLTLYLTMRLCVLLLLAQSLLVQRYIMLAQYWNTTKEKLPKRFDPRKPGWKFQARYGVPPKMQA